MFLYQDSEEIKMVSERIQGEERNQHLPFCDAAHLVSLVTDLSQNMESGMQEITPRG